jgi:ubiquinone/menaquinone biosynthesis C-methylase UbiE
MVAVGLQPHDPTKRITYAVGTAERLNAAGIADASIDLVVAGEAAHYFDHTKTWPELARVLKPRGTVAWIVSWTT